MSRPGVVCILAGLTIGLLGIATFGVTTFSDWLNDDAGTVRNLAAAGPVLGLALIGIGGSSSRAVRQRVG